MNFIGFGLIIIGIILIGVGSVGYQEVGGGEITDQVRNVVTVVKTVTLEGGATTTTQTVNPPPQTVTSTLTRTVTEPSTTYTTTTIKEGVVITTTITKTQNEVVTVTATKTVTQEKPITTTYTTTYQAPLQTSTSTVTYPTTYTTTTTREGTVVTTTITSLKTESTTVKVVQPMILILAPPTGGAILVLKFKLGGLVGFTNLKPIMPGSTIILAPAHYDVPGGDLEVQYGLERLWAFSGVYPSATGTLSAVVENLDGEYGIVKFNFSSVKRGYMYPSPSFWTDEMRNYLTYGAQGDYLKFAEKYGMVSWPKFAVWFEGVYVAPPYSRAKLYEVSDPAYLDGLNHMFQPWPPDGVEVREGVNFYTITSSAQRTVTLGIIPFITSQTQAVGLMGAGAFLLIIGFITLFIPTQPRRR